MKLVVNQIYPLAYKSWKMCSVLDVLSSVEASLFVDNRDSILRHFMNDDESHTICDLYDGEYFQQLKKQVSGPSVSLLVNSDGAPAFKSSKCSVWPLTCAVAELPPSVR